MSASGNSEQRPFEVLSDWGLVDARLASWEQQAADNFMLRREWLESWWDAYHQRTDRLALVTWSGTRPESRGLLPGLVTRGLLGRTFRWLGSGNVCSDYLRLLTDSGEIESGAKAAAAGLLSPEFRTRYGRLDAIELEGHSAQDPSVRCLVNELQGKGWSLEERALGGAWRVSLPATLDEFVARLPKSRRRKVNKARRLLAEGQVRYEAVGDWERIDSLWSEFVRLHQKRRAAMNQSGCFFDPRFGKFLREAVRRFAEQQGVWLGVLWAGEQPIGMNLIFFSGQTANMYQSGMETERSELEPGHLINYFSIGTAIERGAQWFDFLRGDEPYKEGWGAERQELSRVRLFAPHLAARLRQSAIAAGRGLRTWSSSLWGPGAPALPVPTED